MASTLFMNNDHEMLCHCILLQRKEHKSIYFDSPVYIFESHFDRHIKEPEKFDLEYLFWLFFRKKCFKEIWHYHSFPQNISWCKGKIKERGDFSTALFSAACPFP